MATSPKDAFRMTTEHEVLCEMNADFHRSKVELIHRFLSDQEELNKRFAEYALNTDEDTSENEESSEHYEYNCSMLVPQPRTKPHVLTEEDILQDMETRSVLAEDNLSIASAINSSLGAGSDIAVLDEESTLEGEFNFPREESIIFKDQNGNFSKNRSNKSGKGVMHAKAVGVSRHGNLPPATTTKKIDHPNRKPKKLLVKKNVRPQDGSWNTKRHQCKW